MSDVSIKNEFINDFILDIFTDLPTPMYCRDNSGYYLWANKTWLTALGLSALVEIQGKTDFDFMSHEYAKGLLDHDLAVMKSKIQQEFEEKIINSNSKEIVFQSFKNLLHNQNGEMLGVLTTAFDVTEKNQDIENTKQAQSKAESEKLNVEHHLKNVISCTPGYIYWKSRDGYYMGGNSTLLELTNLNTTDELAGKRDDELFGVEEGVALRAHDQEVIKTEKIHVFEEVVTLPTGEVRTYIAEKMPMRDINGNIVGIIGNSIDISRNKRIESELTLAKESAENAIASEEQLRHAVTILAGSIAHDLRTPIASINLFTKRLNQLLQGNIPTEAETILQRLGNITADMNQSIDGTLQALSDAVKGVVDQANLVFCDINRCVKHVFENYPFEADEASLISWNNACPFSFNGNKINFYRVLFNLIKNSLHQIKEQQRGEIIVTTEAGADCNFLKFKDTAGGITEDMIKDIFSGFNTTKQGGTGVGLAFCQLAMQSIGGDIDCQIVDGDCIEFVLSFPRVDV